MNYQSKESPRFSNDTNHSMIEDSMFSNFTNVSEGIRQNIQIKNFGYVSRQMDKLNTHKIKKNNNLYENNPKKNYNGIYPYIKYESDIHNNNYVPQNSYFFGNINPIQPLSKSIILSNQSSSIIENSSDYGEFNSLTESAYNKNKKSNKVTKLNTSQISSPSTSNKTYNFNNSICKDNNDLNHISPKNSYCNKFYYGSYLSNSFNYKNFKNIKSIISY